MQKIITGCNNNELPGVVYFRNSLQLFKKFHTIMETESRSPSSQQLAIRRWSEQVQSSSYSMSWLFNVS